MWFFINSSSLFIVNSFNLKILFANCLKSKLSTIKPLCPSKTISSPPLVLKVIIGRLLEIASITTSGILLL